MADALINMDHAATAALRPQALEAMLPYLSERYANASGTYGAAREARAAIDRARAQVAQAIGARPSEIFFTSGGTEADNWAITGGHGAAGYERRRIVVSRVEHHAVLRACESLAPCGAETAWLDVDKTGRVSVEQAECVIVPGTSLVSVMLANNEVGTIEPVSEIAEMAHRNGALMHTDAVQAVGHIPVDVRALGVDLLSMSAHKFGGPKGMGALFVREGVRIGGFMLGGAQERGLRAGTENTPGIVGMGAALEAAVQEMETEARRVAALRSLLAEQVLCLPGVRINGAQDERLPGCLHVSIRNMDSSLLLARLDMEGIAASAGSACASGALERSHVLRAMYPDEADNEWADLRLTLGAENTEAEVLSVAAALGRILAS